MLYLQSQKLNVPDNLFFDHYLLWNDQFASILQLSKPKPLENVDELLALITAEKREET